MRLHYKRTLQKSYFAGVLPDRRRWLAAEKSRETGRCLRRPSTDDRVEVCRKGHRRPWLVFGHRRLVALFT